MKHLVFVILVSLTVASCGRKWKQEASVQFDLELKSEAVAVTNEINTSLLYIKDINVQGVREQAADCDVTQVLEKQINNNSSEIIDLNIPQGTYTDLDVNVDIAREAGAAHSMRIIGKHHWSGGGFVNFQVDIDDDLTISSQGIDSDGTNTIVLSKSVNRSASIGLDLNTLLDGISEADWIAADGGMGTIVIDSSTNTSLYLYIVDNISNHLEVRFM